MPAKCLPHAAVGGRWQSCLRAPWIPAFAGMTDEAPLVLPSRLPSSVSFLHHTIDGQGSSRRTRLLVWPRARPGRIPQELAPHRARHLSSPIFTRNPITGWYGAGGKPPRYGLLRGSAYTRAGACGLRFGLPSPRASYARERGTRYAGSPLIRKVGRRK